MLATFTEPGLVLAATGGLIFLGVIASKVSDRLGVPALLLFLIIGMLAGSEGLGGIAFDDSQLAQAAGVTALAFILFAGGFSTDWTSVKPVLGRGILLSTLGVLATALLTGLAARHVLGVSSTAGFLLGAIVSSTDAAAVFAVLRSRSVNLRGELRPLLELESGSNDPMAVFLTAAFLELLTAPDGSILALLPLFVAQMCIGSVVGLVLARLFVNVVNRLRLGYEGLYPVALIAMVLVTYGSAAQLGGSGFLAVYLAGMSMGNGRLLHKKSLMRFADGLAWLMQILMFLVLGLLVFPSHLWPVAGKSLLIAAVLIFVARPLATALPLLITRFPVRETLLVSWVGLRGAVPIVLATFPLVRGVPQADLFFNVVFFIVITSALVQGTTINAMASRLGVASELRVRRPYPIEYVESADDSTALHEVEVLDGSPAAGKRIVDLGMPAGALIVLLSRDDDFIVPQGSTVLLPGDRVLLLADRPSVEHARGLFKSDPSPSKLPVG